MKTTKKPRKPLTAEALDADIEARTNRLAELDEQLATANRELRRAVAVNRALSDHTERLLDQAEVIEGAVRDEPALVAAATAAVGALFRACWPDARNVNIAAVVKVGDGDRDEQNLSIPVRMRTDRQPEPAAKQKRKS